MKPQVTVRIEKDKVKEVHTIQDVIVEIFDYDTEKYPECLWESDAVGSSRMCRRIRYLVSGTKHTEEPVKVAILKGKVAKVVIPKTLGIVVFAYYTETGHTAQFE